MARGAGAFDGAGGERIAGTEPAALDDDPLLMDFKPAKPEERQRVELLVGELAL